MTESAGAVHTPGIIDGDGPLELAVRAARQGAADATEAAERFWSAAGLFVARAVYNTSYTVSFGLVFPAAFVAQAVPRNNAAVRGMIDGASAARKQVDSLLGPAPTL
jgi:hypothetical protein